MKPFQISEAVRGKMIETRKEIDNFMDSFSPKAAKPTKSHAYKLAKMKQIITIGMLIYLQMNYLHTLSYYSETYR